jgi:hypothetical protein
MLTNNDPAQPRPRPGFEPGNLNYSRYTVGVDGRERQFNTLSPDRMVANLLQDGYPFAYHKEVLWKMFGGWFTSEQLNESDAEERGSMWFYFMEVMKLLDYMEHAQNNEEERRRNEKLRAAME